MAKGYTSLATVQGYLAVPLTSAQLIAAAPIVDAAEAYIDNVTRRKWLVTGVTAERYDLIKPRLYLRHAPVTAISLIQTRNGAVGATLYTALAGVDYELFDADIGEVRFSAGYSGRDAHAFVTYTANRPIPADLSLAATLIVAHSMAVPLNPERLGITALKVEDIALTFEGVSLAIPQFAADVVAAYQRPLLI